MPIYLDRVLGKERWSVKDYQSGKVTLYEEDYQHMINHTVMVRNEEAVKETVQDPDIVERDRNEVNRRLFYKEVKTATYYSGKFPYTSVVIEYADATLTDGRVVTAFPVKKEGKANAERVYEKDKEN